MDLLNLRLGIQTRSIFDTNALVSKITTIRLLVALSSFYKFENQSNRCLNNFFNGDIEE
jgi:hypothetical protein